MQSTVNLDDKYNSQIQAAISLKTQDQGLESLEQQAEPNTTENIATTLNTGMTSVHQQEFTKFSIHNDVITIWRPINEQAALKLEKGYAGKALATKAKSSNFGPIAGDIPFDVRLSKVATDAPDKIDSYQILNEQALQQAEEYYQPYKNKLNARNCDNFNNLFLITTIIKKDEKEREIYFLVDNHGSIVQSNNMPMFVAKASPSNALYYYDPVNKQFKDAPDKLPADYHLRPVEIVAYRYYSIDKGETIRPITADYDELVSTARKIYPIHHNDNVPTFINQGLQRLASSDPNMELSDIFAHLILNHEAKLRQEYNDKVNAQMLGIVNDWQLNTKIYLKQLTEGATNHGPEVNNPFPEKLNAGNYPAYLPEGTTPIILKNEKELCKFIEKHRREGFPLEVNPKWSWRVNNKGKLFIPTHKFDWDSIHIALDILKAMVIELEQQRAELLASINLANTEDNNDRLSNLIQYAKHTAELEKILGTTGLGIAKQDTLIGLKKIHPDKTFSLPNEETINYFIKLKEDLEKARARSLAEMAIINKKLEIERLILQPYIFYSKKMKPHYNQPLSPYQDVLLERIFLNKFEDNRSLFKPYEKLSLAERLAKYQNEYPSEYKQAHEEAEKDAVFVEKVKTKLHNLEKIEREKQITRLQTELYGLYQKFREDYELELSLIEREDNALTEKLESEKRKHLANKSPKADGRASISSNQFSYFNIGSDRKNEHLSTAVHKVNESDKISEEERSGSGYTLSND